MEKEIPFSFTYVLYDVTSGSKKLMAIWYIGERNIRENRKEKITSVSIVIFKFLSSSHENVVASNILCAFAL